MAERSPTRSLEEEDLTAKMSLISVTSPDQATVAIIQEGPLFDPLNYAALIQIVNQLDPSSFVKFARTCKALDNFCYNTNGIRVKFPCEIFTHRRGPEIKKINGPILDQYLQRLRKMPFIIAVEQIYCEPANARCLEEVRQLLHSFPRVTVESLLPDWNDDGNVNWNALIEFLQEFNVKRVEVARAEIPVDLLPFFLTKLDYFYYSGHVAHDLILSATARHLNLLRTRISKYTFIDLIRKFANEDSLCWWIGREPHYDAGSDPFVEACSEVMKVVKMEIIYRETIEPSVLYNKPSNPRMFYLRKSDGSIGKLEISDYYVNFGTGI